MARRVAYLAVVVGVAVTLTGCAFSFFGYERRAAWHDQEERACLVRREVRTTPWLQPARAIHLHHPQQAKPLQRAPQEERAWVVVLRRVAGWRVAVRGAGPAFQQAAQGGARHQPARGQRQRPQPRGGLPVEVQVALQADGFRQSGVIRWEQLAVAHSSQPFRVSAARSVSASTEVRATTAGLTRRARAARPGMAASASRRVASSRPSTITRPEVSFASP